LADSNYANSNTIFLSVFDYYTQIHAASRMFMDQEVLPISNCQAFMDSLNPCLIAVFGTHFPNYSKSQERTATHQHKVLHEMLQPAFHAKMEYNNISVMSCFTVLNTCV
jgi:hypothetical protein